jgi:hypothetical protein
MGTIFLFLGGLGGPEIVIILLVISIPFGLWLWALIDCLIGEFDNDNKLVWIILIILIPLLGAILYLAIGRNQKVKKNLPSK